MADDFLVKTNFSSDFILFKLILLILVFLCQKTLKGGLKIFNLLIIYKKIVFEFYFYLFFN